eukprot:TRINITY_DN40732_c0_g2_i1.p1 TRINITY_DN40732_c0_g2~~TRINITY_DN40732_c0_g2_i1.p1  ORF type:complete len:853 (+),score=83.82 TRINITY_DN40732_c0_g2_i1:52-2610(+)
MASGYGGEQQGKPVAVTTSLSSSEETGLEDVRRIITHRKLRGDIFSGVHRDVHDMSPTFFEPSSLNQARQSVLTAVNTNRARRTLNVLVVIYLVLGITAVLLDIGAICIDGRHRDVVHDAMMRVGEGSARLRGSRPRKVTLPVHSVRDDDLDPPMNLLGVFEPHGFANSKIDRVVVCQPLNGRQAMAVSKFIGTSCAILSLFLLLEHFLRMFSVGPFYFFQDSLLKIDFCLVISGCFTDLLIVLLLRPQLEASYHDHHDSTVTRVTTWILFLCRLYRLGMLWRVVRTLNSHVGAGVEVARVMQALDVMKSKAGGMPKVIIHRVQIIRNSPSELSAYREKITALTHHHGSVEENLLFFGSCDVSPDDILESVEGWDECFFRSELGSPSKNTIPSRASHAAERPVYTDSCYSFTNWDTDTSRRTRKMFVVRALTSAAVDVSDRTLSSRGDMCESSNDCSRMRSETPTEYQPQSLGLRKRDVSSTIYKFQHNNNLVLPLAVVTYENPNAFHEIESLRKAGARSWIDLFAGPHRTHEQKSASRAYEEAIDSGDPEVINRCFEMCVERGIPQRDIDCMKSEAKARSEDAGVSLAYILSDEFEKLAQTATGKTDPTFSEMKGPLFCVGDQRIGEGLLCARDFRPGRAFVDTLAPQFRQKATTFMSWVWGYKMSVVRDCLRRWAARKGLRHDEVFLYVCFFCNNQWRLLVEGSSSGADNLEEVFEQRLRKIGSMVAIVDSWKDSVYITRIWTIYEQYMASKLEEFIVEFALPTLPAATLIEELESGKLGIENVIVSISQVHAEHARASMEADERKVKHLISTSTGGFQRVNGCVKRCLVQWIANEFKTNIDRLVEDSSN